MTLCIDDAWDDSLDDDDICIGISSAMHESLEDDYYEKERSNMIIKANEAYKNCEKEIKEIHKAVNKCIAEFIMPAIRKRSKRGRLGYKFNLWDVSSYYVSKKYINYAHPEGRAFSQQLIQKLEDYGYIVKTDSTLVSVFWYKYQEDNNVNNS